MGHLAYLWLYPLWCGKRGPGDITHLGTEPEPAPAHTLPGTSCRVDPGREIQAYHKKGQIPAQCKIDEQGFS